VTRTHQRRMAWPRRLGGVAAVTLLAAGTFVLALGSSSALADTVISATAIAPPQGGFGALGAVSCPALGTCIAVGGNEVQVNTEGEALAATLSNGAWSSVPLPLPANAQTAVTSAPDMSSIVCTSAQACVAVGTYLAQLDGEEQEEGLVETEQAGTWQVVSTGTLALSAIACRSSDGCTAAGVQYSGSGAAPVVATQSGSSWVPSPVSLPSDSAGFQGFTGIACPASGSCIAVGFYANSSGSNYPVLATQSDGSWQGVSVAPPEGSSSGALTGISCPTSGLCTAVGTSDVGGFVISGNQEVWQPATLLPAPPDAMSGLAAGARPEAVACADSGSCTAVGAYVATSDECYVEASCSTHPFVDVETNGSWNAQAAPTPPDSAPVSPQSSSGLTSVACSSSGDCTAVGTYDGTSYSMFAVSISPSNITRVYGTTAIETSIAVSQAEYPNADSANAVVLARSDYFSDALAGGPLAAAVGGPLLITPGAPVTSSLDPEVQAEIQRVLPAGKTVYILGGNLALDPSIDATLQGLGYLTQRIGGDDEYATAVDIANRLGNPSTIFEATGLNFADALSAVPAAIEAHGAILLTNGPTQAPETATYLAANPGDTRYAVGGPLAAAGADPSAIGVYGQDQYDTAAAVATRFFPNASVFGAATGVDFPDALSGGVFLGQPGTAGPMLLVEPSGPLPTSVAMYLSGASSSLTHGYLFGGPLAVGDDVLSELQAMF
jgi:putative cell wall-binding protein